MSAELERLKQLPIWNYPLDHKFKPNPNCPCSVCKTLRAAGYREVHGEWKLREVIR